MAINFPNSPNTGDQYTYNGVIWQYNGSGWYIVGNTTNVKGFTGPPGPTGSTGPTGPAGLTGAGYTGAEIRSNYLYITKIYSDGTTQEVNLGYIGPTGSSFVFDSDLIAAFGTGKSFGKYLNGETIPALGKTAVQVIQDALVAILAPTINLSSPTTIAFNQTAIGNTLNFNYVINSLNAGPTVANLEFKRSNGTTWGSIFTGTGSCGSTCYFGSYYHTLTDTNYNTNGFNYRYSITDTSGGTAIAGLTITPASYSTPTISITQIASATAGPETNTKREKGNVGTNISATITRNSSLVGLCGWEFLYSSNGGSYVTTGFTGAITGNPASATTGVTLHIPANTISSITYRLTVQDSYQNYLGSSAGSAATQINFVNLIFQGPTAASPTTSTEIRGLPLSNRKFVDSGNTFTLNTGTAYKNFVVALPSKTISSVIDQTALNVDLTSQYVLNSGFTYVNDYAGNTTSYNIYVMSPAGTYSTNHEHIVTTA